MTPRLPRICLLYITITIEVSSIYLLIFERSFNISTTKDFTETFDINIKESVCSLFTAHCTTGCGLSQVELDETNCNLHSCLLKIHLKKTKHNEFTICCFDPVVLNSHRMVTTKPRHVPNGDFCVLLITLPLTHHHTPELQVLS